MATDISLHRVATRSRSCAHSVCREAQAAVVESPIDRKHRVEVRPTLPRPRADRLIVHSDARTCRGRKSTNARRRGVVFGPHPSVGQRRESSGALCTGPYFLVTWDTACDPESGHRMLRNKSHSRHVSASGLALDRGYTAVSIRDRLIDKAFVYCKNLRCKG
jgi:hypothetical protein